MSGIIIEDGVTVVLTSNGLVGVRSATMGANAYEVLRDGANKWIKTILIFYKFIADSASIHVQTASISGADLLPGFVKI